MFRNFVSSGDMTEEEVAEFKKHFETKNNFILDSDGDYTKSLEVMDVIISDYTSLIIEESSHGCACYLHGFHQAFW